MAYDEKLADRVRKALEGHEAVIEKKMFGGVAFMVGGNMCCGIVRDDLMVRVGPDGFADALRQPHARPMDFTGRPMKGMVYVSAAGLRTDTALRTWVRRGVDFAASLPAK
jgi:TfoX/Sxy family transcriptional regulator of competence genes